MKGIATFLLESAVDSVHKRRNDLYDEGYIEGANVCLGLLEKKLTEFQKRAASGDFLSEHEQFLSGKLFELKAEMEKELRDFWDRSGPSSVRAAERS